VCEIAVRQIQACVHQLNKQAKSENKEPNLDWRKNNK
jgi:hypothetical protein